MRQTVSRKRELRLKGTAVAPGIAIGRAFVLRGGDAKVEARSLTEEQINAEIEKFVSAVNKTKEELTRFRAETAHLLGEDDAKIFDVHKMMLEDELIVDETIRRIKSEHQNADLIFSEIVEKYESHFSDFDDEYLKARGADLRDIRRRVIRHIQGDHSESAHQLPYPSVLIADYFSPADTISLERSKILGFATELGSRTSHAAIMARSLKVPSAVGFVDSYSKVSEGDEVILDGNAGLLIVHPTAKTLKKYKKLQLDFIKYEHKLKAVRSMPARTKDGKDIELSANIEFYNEVESALDLGARGIGLYRTEYLYLTRTDLPSEKEQFEEYKRILKALRGQPIMIRTFDLGGDKAKQFFNIPYEANPFLGFRGIRLYPEREDVFRTQLRAILRASVYGNVRILFPMISCVTEMRYCRRVLLEVKKELKSGGASFSDNIDIGAMIEVPSAAVSADLIAKECDFLSIGTNDLIQYTLAVDRGNTYVSSLYQTFNPAVLRLIRDIIRHGHEQGVWVGMCGEMASDLKTTMILIGLGLDEFSVSPVSLLSIKEIIRRVEFSECLNLAERALSFTTPEEVEDYLIGVMKRKFKDLLFE